MAIGAFRKRRGTCAGFTLIELLVVIAIIAILAAILFPVLIEARKTALRVSCMSQMRQVYQAVANYSGDRNGFLPPVTYNIQKTYDESKKSSNRNMYFMQLWASMCEPYFKKSRGDENAGSDNHLSWRILRCPSTRKDPARIFDPTNVGYYWWWNWSLCANPGYNYYYLSPCDDQAWPHPQTIGSPARPAQTIMFVEAGYAGAEDSYGYYLVEPPTGDNPPLWPGDQYWYGGWPQIQPYGWCWPRHKDTANVIWTDGHATTLRVGQLKDNTLWDLR